MNSTERYMYDKYANDETFEYVYKVYMEFERRVNATSENYDGLKFGECRFDYDSWEKRLLTLSNKKKKNKEDNKITHKQMITAIKKLTEEDKVITQTFRGIKNNSSIYFLNRFEEISNKFKEQKKEQNEEQNKEQKNTSKIKGLEYIKEQNEEQNEEQNKVRTSKNNNLRIKSSICIEQQVTQKTHTKKVKNIEEDKILDSQVEQILNLYPVTSTSAKTVSKKIRALIKNKKIGFQELTKCVYRYIEFIKLTRENKFHQEYMNVRRFFIDEEFRLYLNDNPINKLREEIQEQQQKAKEPVKQVINNQKAFDFSFINKKECE